MRVEIKDVHYGNNIINKIYYGSNLVFDRFTDKSYNVYVFNLTKVTSNYTLTLQNINEGTQTNWGDGMIDTSLTHTYASQGIYTVKTRQRVNTTNGNGNTNTKKSLIECTNIDNTLTVCSFMFIDCTGLTNAPIIPNSVTNCDTMFDGCTGLTNAPIIPNSVTNCSFMFNNCTSLTSIPQTNIDLMQAVKNGTNTICADYMYCYGGCTHITSPQTYATLLSLYSNWFTM
jgi:hypothetical protein